MATSLDRASEKYGLAPGTLVHVGRRVDSDARVSVIEYGKDIYEAYPPGTIAEIVQRKRDDSVVWVNVEGLHEVELVESIGAEFGVHPLVLEDILNTHQRPKFEEYQDYLYIVFKNLDFDQSLQAVHYEQISILLSRDFVFTFKERVDDIFEPIKTRIQNSKGRLRAEGPDYLAYVVLDTVVDRYFAFEDALDAASELLEDRALSEPGSETLSAIQDMKREMIFVRRNIVPVRELLSALLRSDSDLVRETTKIYLRDVYDHAIRVIESIETYRDLVSSILEIYLSSISNRMNAVMKVLTVFATIFIPLTFVAGIYGMNFEYMPELKWKWAYPVVWAGFITVAGGLLLYFKRKKWF